VPSNPRLQLPGVLVSAERRIRDHRAYRRQRKGGSLGGYHMFAFLDLPHFVARRRRRREGANMPNGFHGPKEEWQKMEAP